VLGNTFLKLCRTLFVSVPIIDPSLFIHRFAQKLRLPYTVGTTALHLVRRMRKDWIVEGRRPAGVCGACLFMAARLHGLERTQQEIIDAVRICDMTLRERLQEFVRTPASDLTPDQFAKIGEDLPEFDPPSFMRARFKEAGIEVQRKRRQRAKAVEPVREAERAAQRWSR
jgi:transcription factor IIIB subunit 2